MFYSRKMNKLMEKINDNRRMIDCYKLILDENETMIQNEIKHLENENELLKSIFIEEQCAWCNTNGH